LPVLKLCHLTTSIQTNVKLQNDAEIIDVITEAAQVPLYDH
jgi:hypothetical protein